jgi:hypothetical protein
MRRVRDEEGYPMGRTRIRVVVLAVLFTVGAGVIAVQASPQCQRFVKTYVTTPVRNRVSKATEIAWAKWRVEHPNWKPKPGVTRPKYKQSRQETMDKVAFACEVPSTPAQIDLLFTPADFEPPPVINWTPTPTETMETTEVTFPDLIPPVVAENTPIFGVPNIPDVPGLYVPPFNPPVGSGRSPAVPLTPPGTPTPIAATPEPSSFFLVVLGMASGWFFWLRRTGATV